MVDLYAGFDGPVRHHRQVATTWKQFGLGYMNGNLFAQDDVGNLGINEGGD